MKKRSQQKKSAAIVIDQVQGLVFKDEDELYEYFAPQIQRLEKEYFLKRRGSDFKEQDFSLFEEHLAQALEEPDEIWEDLTYFENDPLRTYIKFVDASSQEIDQSSRQINNTEEEEGSENNEDPFYYVALCRMTGEVPSFVYLHFPTNDEDLLEDYRRGRLLYDKALADISPGALDGDALMEGDTLAEGLYRAMLSLRGDKDIAEDQFHTFKQMREDTLEEPDEIWRSTDSQGYILVTFIKDCAEEGEESLFYVVVTQEDVASQSHALMFSFPTTDKSLADRYRHGENLQADEVVQESSH